MSTLPDPQTFLSGRTGHVAGLRRTAAARSLDAALDALLVLRRTGSRLDALALAAPVREVLVLGVARPGAALPPLRSERHAVRVLTRAAGERGKFQNLNLLLEEAGEPADWTLVVDDDVELPPRFLDRFVGVCEAQGFALAQPAQTRASHAAWPLTRRRAGMARETPFVEIGPVTAFRRDAAAALMPFPDLRYGWGLDLHWAAVAEERGLRRGIVDALPVRHERTPVASAYPFEDAIAEAREFLASRPYLTADRVR